MRIKEEDDMKKILKGFTLAEVLVTLSIVGVIAALTLPSLSLNVQKQQIGPALAKAINTLEYANKLALEQNQVRRLSDLVVSVDSGLTDEEKQKKLSESYLDDVLVPYMKLYKLSKQISYVGAINAPGVSIQKATDVYSTPDNIFYMVQASYVRNGISLFVDVNGSKGPNLAGRDLLALWVYDDGGVVARGGRAFTMRQFSSGSLDDLLVEGRVDNPNLTYSEQRCNDTKITSWLDCAGRIADNNYQVDY